MEAVTTTPGGYGGGGGVLDAVNVIEVPTDGPGRTVLATADVMYALLPEAYAIAACADPGATSVEARYANFAAVLRNLAARNYGRLRVYALDSNGAHVRNVPQLPPPSDLLQGATWRALRDRGFTVTPHYEPNWQWDHWLVRAFPHWATAYELELEYVDIVWHPALPRWVDYHDEVLAAYARRNMFDSGAVASCE